jgi:arylsulfatase
MLAVAALLLGLGIARRAAMLRSGEPGPELQVGEPRRPHSVLLVTVDTLRADHLGVYGYGRETSPWLDGFAAGAAVFESATTPRSKTTPAVASMLTGLYPHNHGVRTLYQPLPPEPVTLAEILDAAGYETAAFVSNFVLRADFCGLERGFDLYDDDLPAREPNRPVFERGAKETCDAVRAWLGAGPRAPFFLWIHLIDPHGPYLPPRRPFEAQARRPLPPGTIPEYQDTGSDDLEDYVGRYDGEIRYADEEIGALFADLDRAGLLEDALVVFGADHGEGFGEHGEWFEHGADVFEPCARIPFVLRHPGGRGAGLRLRAPVSLVDVVPTVLDAIGLETEVRFDGVSLLPFLERPEAEDGVRYLEKEAELRAVRTADRKVVATLERGRIVRMDRYDLRADPGETKALPPSDDPTWKRLESLLRQYVERSTGGDLRAGSLLRGDGSRLDPDTAAALRALGYL